VVSTASCHSITDLPSTKWLRLVPRTAVSREHQGPGQRLTYLEQCEQHRLSLDYSHIARTPDTGRAGSSQHSEHANGKIHSAPHAHVFLGSSSVSGGRVAGIAAVSANTTDTHARKPRTWSFKSLLNKHSFNYKNGETVYLQN
jgi:hypothetical protein